MSPSPRSAQQIERRFRVRFSLRSLLTVLTIVAACLPTIAAHGWLGIMFLAPTAFVVSTLIVLIKAGQRRLALVHGLTYLTLWAVTAWVGTADVREHTRSRIIAIRHRHFGDPGPFVELGDDPKRKATTPKHAPPWFFVGCECALCPFVVAVDYSYLAGELDGEGGRAYFLWFFGYEQFAPLAFSLGVVAAIGHAVCGVRPPPQN